MPEIIPLTSPEFDQARIIERPDGFYWQSKHDETEFGPFATLLDTVTDMEDAENEAGETLSQMEAEIGQSDWIDQETGLPAEESTPRLEDH